MKSNLPVSIKNTTLYNTFDSAVPILGLYPPDVLRSCEWEMIEFFLFYFVISVLLVILTYWKELKCLSMVIEINRGTFI